MISPSGPKALQELAPNPAGLRVSPILLFKRNPKMAWDFASRCLVFAVGCGELYWPLVAAGILLFFPWAIRIRKMVRLYSEGEAHAARLVSVEPPLIAVWADLAKVSLEPRPVIVIVFGDLSFERKDLATGDRIAVVAKPSGASLQSYDRLEVGLASLILDNPYQIQNLIDSVPEWQWDELDEALFEVPHPYSTGVFEPTHIEV